MRRAMGEAGDGRDGDSAQSSAEQWSSSSDEADEQRDSQLGEEVVDAAGEMGRALMRRADGEGTEVRRLTLGVDRVRERMREESVGMVGDREARSGCWTEPCQLGCLLTGGVQGSGAVRRKAGEAVDGRSGCAETV